MRDNLTPHGRLRIRHWREGLLLRDEEKNNLIVNAGKAAMAGLLMGAVSNFFDYIALGTSGTAAAATDTALGAEISTLGGSRVAATLSRVTTSVTNDTAQFVGAWTFSGTLAIVEAGIFDTNAAGTMLSRQTFSAYNVVNGDSMTITWKVQF